MEQPVPATATPAPSAAPVSAETVISSLSHEERGTWEETGDLPERVTITTRDGKTSDAQSQESSPAAPATPAASTDASTSVPASETGQPAERKGAKARTAELDADINGLQERLKLRKALREELASLERQPANTDARPAASSPATAPTQQDWKRIMAHPEAPKESDFDSYADYTAAASYFVTQSVLKEHHASAQADTAVQREVQAIQTDAASAAERIKQHAESPAGQGFIERVDPRLLDLETASVRRLKGQPIGPQHVLAEETIKSPAVVPLLEHFSTPEGQQEWARLCRLAPSDLMRAFGRLEARFDTDAPSAPAPKTTSSAPAPPVVLGTRNADTADPLEAAIKRKDQAAYVREANKRDLAAMGL